MKDHINFEVYGSTRDEVHENATKEYQRFLGNPEASLPGMARISSEPYIREADGSVSTWRADVDIVI